MADQITVDLTSRAEFNPVAIFKALGEPTRLQIFEFLQACCCPVELDDSGDVRRSNGLTAGEVCCHITGVEKVTSTISEHLKELRLAGLINVERRGKNMFCVVNEHAVNYLKNYFSAAKQEGLDQPPCC